jgi:hypothetical protein
MLFLLGVHLGLKKMYMGISQFYFWKGLYVDVANFVRQCSQCSETVEVQTSGSGQPQQLEHSSSGDDSVKDKSTRSGNTSKVWQKVREILLGMHFVIVVVVVMTKNKFYYYSFSLSLRYSINKL